MPKVRIKHKNYNVSRMEKVFLRVYRESSLKSNDGACLYCYEPLNYRNVTADHRVPKSKGGLNRQVNIDGICHPCNQAKGSLSKAEYINIISSFPSGMHINYVFAWSRRRINLQINRTCKRLKKVFGLKDL